MESIDIKKISNISILLTGFSKTGKSTLLSHFTGESLGGFSGQITNISMECIQKEISIDTNKTINVTFWDTPGQKRFRAIVANAVIKMQGIMLIFDVTSKESFTIIEKLIDNFKETIDIATIPISIVGNKIDLEDKRVVSYDEAMKFAEDNRFRYYETSAQSGEGIKEAFTDLIVNAYYKVNLIVKKEEQVNQIDNKKENNENDVTINNNPKEEKTIVRYHEKDLSTIELKNLISMIEKEDDVNTLYKMIIDIKNYLQDMKPIKCDISYQKYFSLIFRKISIFQQLPVRNYLFVNIYIQLFYVFPELKLFLNSLNKQYKILQLIHSTINEEQKKEYFEIHTFNYKIFDHLTCNDLVKIFNFNVFRLMKDLNQFLSFLNSFLTMIHILYFHFKVMKSDKASIGRNNSFPYIVELIQSFGDVLIYIIVYSQFSKNKIEIKQVLKTLKSLIRILFEIDKTFVNTLDKDILHNIMCVFCILFSVTDANNILITNYILDFIRTYTKKSFSLMIDILYSMNRPDAENNVLLHKFSKKMIVSYFTLINETETSNIKTLEENSFLKDYNKYMGQIAFSNKKINVYRGLFLLLSYLYKNPQLIIDNDDDICPPNILLKELCCFFINERDLGKEIYLCKEEMITFIEILIETKYKEFTNDDWMTLIYLVNIVNNNSLIQKPYQLDIPFLLNIFKMFSLNFSFFQYQPNIIKSVNDLILSLFYKQKYINSELFLFIFEFTIIAIKTDTFGFLESYILFGFQRSKMWEKKMEENAINKCLVIQHLVRIVRNKGKEAREQVRKVVIRLYNWILDAICQESKETIINFVDLISNLIILSSKKKYQEMIHTVFAFPSFNSNDYYEEDELIRREKKIQILLDIYTQVFTSINNENLELLQYLIDFSLSQKLFYEYFYFHIKACDYKTISFTSIILKDLSQSIQGNKFFFSSSKISSININFILYNYIYQIGEWTHYPNIRQYKIHLPSDMNRMKFNIQEMPYCFEVMEICLDILYCFSEENLKQIILIYIFILQRSDILICSGNHYSICSIIRFIMKINYLLNFQSEEFYLNSLDKQTNEAFFSFSKTIKLKESIVKTIIKLIKISSSYYIEHFVTLFIFYCNSAIDYPTPIKENNKLIKRINHIIIYLQTKNENSIIQILFMLKEILKYSNSSQIIQYITLLLNIGKFGTSTLSSDNSLCCDILCWQYLLFLNQRSINEEIKKYNSYLLNLLSSVTLNERNIIFKEMVNHIILKNEKRSNIDVNEVIKNIKQYTIISGKNKILLSKNNTIIEITPTSNYQYECSFSLTSKEEKVINDNKLKMKNLSSLFKINNHLEDTTDNDFYNNNIHFNQNIDNNIITELKQEIDPEVIKQRENRVCSILRIPILITYHVNIFYYPNDYNEFSIEDLLSEIDSDGISPLFLYFLCQLGNVYIDEKGEKVLSYSDSIYNIIFELVDLKNSIEEKLNLINSNSINIIWMENSFIDISNMSSLFTKINPYTNYEIITITPKSDTHLLVRTNQPERFIKNFMSWEYINAYSYLNLKNYYININAYSSIRYFINEVIMTCDYYNNKAKKENCFYQRLDLISTIDEIKKTKPQTQIKNIKKQDGLLEKEVLF